MSDRILVSTDWLNDCAMNCRQIQSYLGDARSQLSGVNRSSEAGGNLRHGLSFRLRSTGRRFSGSDVKEDLAMLQTALDALMDDTGALIQQLRSAANNFESAESAVSGMASGTKKGASKAAMVIGALNRELNKLPSLYERWREELNERREELRRKSRERADRQQVFDGEGAYGGNQGAPMADKAHYDDFRDIIERNTGRRLTDSELKKYLSRLNSEGCGYVFMTNTIFKAYEGRSEDFRRDFGFPMYKNGDLNYNDLLVDIYSSTDNYVPNANGSGYTYNRTEDYNGFFKDGIEKFYDPTTDNDGRGITMDELENRANKYLEEHGMHATVNNYDNATPDHCITSVEDYQNKVNSGELTDGQVHVFVGNPFFIYDSNGQQIRYEGGHYMTITGVEDGRYKVSSWGDTYYIDPNDGHGFIYYQNMEIQQT